MLQQTQVATVVRYYQDFLARFPTVASLAAAEEQEVLRLWEGLGYYRRARQLHAAARRIVDDHGGVFPLEYEAVARLPGIGRYSAGAILSFAADQRWPILEANTERLLARLLGYRGDPKNAAGQRLLWQAAEAILPPRGSGLINQALMELGSQICTPHDPACSLCPVASRCIANRQQLQDRIPAKGQKPTIELTREAAVVIRHGGKILVVQRAAHQRWAGLWDFPRFALGASSESDAESEVVATMAELCRVRIVLRRTLTTIRHAVTRFRITLTCYEAELASRNNKQAHQCDIAEMTDREYPFADQRWVGPHELTEYPLSTTGRKIARLLTPIGASHRPNV
jgi:A/G-specific adenine glycosylase